MRIKQLFGALTALGAIAIMSVTAHAATTYSAGTVSGTTDSTVTVPVNVTTDSTSTTVSGYIMKFTYDSSLVTPQVAGTDATSADCYATAGSSFGGDNTVLVSDIVDSDTTDNSKTLVVAWASASPVSVAASTTETMANVNFTVASTVTESVPVQVSMAALTNDGSTNVDTTDTSVVNVANGEITLDNKGLLGDVNNDTLIDGTDVTLLTQLVNKVYTTDELNALYADADYRANVNEDTSIDGTDVTLLTQFVNKVITSFK